MKIFQQNMKKIIATVGVFLGAFALSVFAGTWTPSAETPPEGNVDAPINVGTADQFKTGGLAVSKNAVPSTGYVFEVEGPSLFTGFLVTGDVRIFGNTYTNKIQIGDANAAEIDYVLTKKNTEGEAVWRAAPAPSSSIISANVDISTWPKAWYSAVGGDDISPITMAKVAGPSNSSNYGHDMGGCPGKAIVVGFDKNGPGNIAVQCAAPVAADLPVNFQWSF